MYENRIVIVIKNNLPAWQKLNVAAFLASAVAIQFPETHGQEFINASASHYMPFLRQPVLIYKAETEAELKRALNRAKDRELSIGIYTEPLFATKGEAENLAEIAKCTDENQALVGLVLYGEAKKISKAIEGLKFHD